MNFNKKISSYCALSSNVKEVCRPLEGMGIIGFFYIRIFPNGEFIDLTARPDWSEFYLRRLYQNKYPHQAISNHVHIDEGISLWELDQSNPIWLDGKSIFGYGNGISLCQNKKTYKEIFSYYATQNNHMINQFYINNIDLLKKFNAYFLEKADPLIILAFKNKFFLPKQYHPAGETTGFKRNMPIKFASKKLPSERYGLHDLSPRQLECLSWLVKGKSAEEIGMILGLSAKTIENYLADLKNRWECTKLTQLAYIAGLFGII